MFSTTYRDIKFQYHPALGPSTTRGELEIKIIGTYVLCLAIHSHCYRLSLTSLHYMEMYAIYQTYVCTYKLSQNTEGDWNVVNFKALGIGQYSLLHKIL